MVHAWALLLLLTGWPWIAGAAEPPANSGVPGLSVSITARSEPPPTTLQDVQNARKLANDAGARADFLSFTWKELEPSSGTYALSNFNASINNAAKAYGHDILLNIKVIDTTVKATPSDLAGAPFNSPQMKQRFRALVDAIRPALDPHVKYFSVGNEVNVYLEPANDWPAYADFFADAKSHLKSAAPWIQTGVSMTYFGMLQSYGGQAGALAAAGDVLILTYYPLGNQFVPLGSDRPLTDIPAMADMAEGKPLVLQEVGYPSSSALSSSQTEQAEFVANVFRAWKQRRSEIAFVNFIPLHDFSRQFCENYANYIGLGGNSNFIEYVCSIGLRQATGVPKEAWTAFVNGASSMVLVPIAPEEIGVKAFPNPFRPSDGRAMTLSRLPALSDVRIYTILGAQVAKLEADASGSASWDGRSLEGEIVPSGVYICAAEGADGRRTFKIAVQR